MITNTKSEIEEQADKLGWSYVKTQIPPTPESLKMVESAEYLLNLAPNTKKVSLFKNDKGKIEIEVEH